MEKLLHKIKKEGVTEIIEMAMDNYIENFDSAVFYDSEKDEYFTALYSGGSFDIFDKHIIEVYRIKGNMIACDSYEVEDILDLEEYDELLKKISEKYEIDLEDAPAHCSISDQEDLDLIGVCFRERLKEMMIYNADYIEDEIIRNIAEEMRHDY